MTPFMMRQLWSLVETTQSNILLSLDDTSLVQWLLKQLRMERSLDCSEADSVDRYIRSRLTLIRDMAQGR
jgi:hypothetical protein